METTDKKKKKKNEGFKKRKRRKVAEIKYTRNEKNFWPHKIHYYFYVVMLGNGPDFLPYMLCFALELSGGLFLIMYLVSCFMLGMPMIYMEIFLGRYTQMTNSQMYRMVPIFFGFGIMVLVMNIFYIPLTMVQTSHFFINFMKLMIEYDLFRNCPQASGHLCYNKPVVNLTGALGRYFCEHGDYNCPYKDKIKYTTEYIYWQIFKSELIDEYPIWQLLISLVVTWLVIGTFLILGMRVIGAILKATTIVSWIIFLIIFVMALTMPGGASGLEHFFGIHYEKLNVYKCMVVAFYSIGKLGFLVPTGYMTASAYAKFPKRLGTGAETLLLVTANVLISMFFLSGMFAIGGALADAYNVKLTHVVAPLYGLYLALITQFLTFMECPNSFMLLYLLCFWLIQVVKVAVGIHLLVLNLYDYLPQLSYFPNYVVMSVVGVCGVMSLIGCLKVFVNVIQLLAVNYIVLCLNVHTFIESVCVFYCYGVKRLCDDIHFMTGRKPMRFWLILWYALPFVSLVSFIVIVSNAEDLKHIESLLAHTKLAMSDVYGGSSVLFISLLVSFMGSFLFVVLGFRNTSTNLLKPQFFWGPPRRDIRVSRKSFAPRTSIRSQPPRKKKQRFRVRSIKQMHEKDIAEHVKKGRIFVDTAYFKNVHLTRGQLLAYSV